MAGYSPLSRLLKLYKNDDEDEVENIYDDGSVWTKPEHTTSQSDYLSPIKTSGIGGSFELGLKGLVDSYQKEVPVDPLQSSRNQVDYYTGKLDELGQEAKKPSVLDNVISGFTRLGAIPGTAFNTITGSVNEQLNQAGDTQKKIDESGIESKLKELGFTLDRGAASTGGGFYAKSDTKALKGLSKEEKLSRREQADAIVNDFLSVQEETIDKTAGGKQALKIFTKGIESGANTSTGLVTGKYSDKAVDIGRLLDNQRVNPNQTVRDFVKLAEAPGYYGYKMLTAPANNKWDWSGADEESAQAWGNIVADLGASVLLEGNLTDIDGAGKTIKALRKGDKLSDISKVNKFDDALELAKKYNSYDDYVSSLGDKASKYSDEVLEGMYNKSLDTYANDLMKDVNKGLGGINGFEGLKIGNNVVLDPTQIAKISTNKLQSGLLQVGLGLYSPVGALMSNPLTDGIGKVIDKTETGTALKKDVSKLFGGGKNNEWINSMKDNPKDALKYANERKQVGLAKKMSDDRVQEVMEDINKYSDMKETPEEITKIIEEPTTRKTREVEVEKEINNPQYISKMMKLGKEEYNKQSSSIRTMQNKLKAQKDELLEIAKKDTTTYNSQSIAGIDSEISNLQKRLDKLDTIKGAKSLDFNKQMAKFGYKEDYTDMFDKAISTDIETLTKEVGDRDLAEALQESSNRVLDQLDKEFPGLSENFTSYSKVNADEVLTGKSSDFEGEDLIERAKKVNVKYDASRVIDNEEYRTKLGKAIARREYQQGVWEKFSKESGMFEEGSGDVVEDILDRAYKRKNGVSNDPLQYNKKFRNELSELQELKRPRTAFEKETDTVEEIAQRKKEITRLERIIKATENKSIEKYGKVDEFTGEIYNELNSKETQELQQLTLSLNKEALDKYRKLERVVKEQELIGTGYLEKKSARKVAPRLKEELGLKESIPEITKGLMLDGAEYVKKLKTRLYRDSFDTVMNLSDDEFDIIQRQMELRKPFVFKLNKSEKNKYNMSEKELSDEAKLSKIIADQRQADANITKDISPLSGKNRDTFADIDEEERFKAKKPQEYMGTTEEGMEINKDLEKMDMELMARYRKNRKLHDTLVEKYGKKGGLNKYNEIRAEESYRLREQFKRDVEKHDYQKELEKQRNAIDNQEALQEVAVSSDKIVPIDPRNPLGKATMSKLPEDIKHITGIKLNTANGEIVIDKNIKKSELKTILDNRNYGKAEKGSKIIYTNEPYKKNGAVGTYYHDSDTIIINVNNLSKKHAQTILEHEMGHRVASKIAKEYPNLTEQLVSEPLIKYFKGLDDVKKEEFIDIIGLASNGDAPTKEMLDVGIVSKYLDYFTKKSKSEKKITNETFAELFSLYNNKNKTVSNKMMNFDKEAYDTFLSTIDQMPTEEVKNVSKLVRKRVGDDYANQLLELSNKREAVLKLENKISEAAKLHEVMDKASDITKTGNKIDDLKKELKEFGDSMDKHEFDDDGNIISTDYDTFFEDLKLRNPKQVEKIDEIIPRYKKVKQMEDELFEIDNTVNLSPEATEFIDKFKKHMKDIAIREGIYSEEQAENFMTYVLHTINPKYADDAEIIEKGRMLKAELQDPLNVNAISRNKEGTIQEINAREEAQTGKRIFEENINRLLLKRTMDSEKTMMKTEANHRLLEEFSIPVIRNFDEHINSADHVVEFYGKDLTEKLGISEKELKRVYKESGKNSLEFMKDNYFEDFKKTLPDFKSFEKEKDFINFLDKDGYDGFYKSKMLKSYREGNFEAIETLAFESAYPMTNKFNYARSLQEKYGYADYVKDPLKNIPKTTEDGRPYVLDPKNKADRTKEMPYGIEGTPIYSTDPIKAYTEYVYKEAKNQNKIIVELPKEKPETVVKRTISNKAMEEVVKNKTTMAEKISMMMKGDKEAIEGFDVLAGYNVIDPNKITLEEFQVDSGTKKILIDKNAWENYQKAIKDAEYKEKSAVLKIYDYMNNVFKSQALFSVGFHLRNSIQNVIASYVKTGINMVDLKKFTEGLDIMSYHNGSLDNFTKEYGGYNIDEILREAENGGIFETEVKNLFEKDKTKEFLEGKTDKLKTKKTSLGKSINPFSTEFVGYKASNKLGGAIEEQAKIINIITHLENGMNLSDAIHLTKETLFDYSDLTQFESKVMKRALPFYTFMRKNIPSQIDNLANHSARVSRVQGVYDKASEKNESDRERALRPEYLDGQLALGNQKYLNLGNATDDLKKLTNPLEMASGLNPLIKTPIELIFNTQMYSGSDISKYDKTSEKVKYTIQSNVPITKQVSALHKLITGSEKEQDGAMKVLSRTAGNMVNSYDIDKQEKATMYQYVEELQNQYYEYLEKNPEAKAELEAEKKKSVAPGYESPISKLLKKKR